MIGLEMKKPVWKPVALASYALLAMTVHVAQADPGKAMTRPQAEGKVGGSAALPMVDGEVEDVDIPNKYVILKHGPIANLNMDAMTMAFSVKDLAMLTKLKVGDKVRFTAKNVADVPTIMSLEVQK
jgi:Cu/Ag efflux protein CusF